MNLSELAFRFIFLFIPGLIVFNIVNKLTFHREFKTPDILLGSLTYGFFCYFIYYYIFILAPSKILSSPEQPFYFLEDLTDVQSKLNFQEIAIVTGLAVPIGLLSTAFVNSKLLYKIASKLSVSDKSDDIGVWNKTFESINNWIIIRDIQSDLMYRGWVETFSDGIDDNEILIKNVDVYRNSSGETLYSTPWVYISLNKKDNIRIEFQSGEFTENMNTPIAEPQLNLEKEKTDQSICHFCKQVFIRALKIF